MRAEPRPPRRSGSAPERSPAAEEESPGQPLSRIDAPRLVAIACATTIGLEEIRVFLSYLVWTEGEAVSRTTLGLLAALPFAGAALAGLFLTRIGPRRGLLLSAVWLAIGYLAEHSSDLPIADLLLSGVCVLLWGWFLVGALVTLRRGTALGLVIGSSIDLALRLAFFTVDLPWTSDPLATACAVTLAVLLIWAARGAVFATESVGEPTARRAVTLLALGPWLAIGFLVTGNPGQLMARTGSDFGTIAGAAAVGYAAGISLVLGMTTRPLMAPGLTLLGALGALAFIPLWLGWLGGPVWVAVAATSSAVLLGGALRTFEGPATRPSASATAIGLSFGLVGCLGALYLTYAVYDSVPLVAGLVLALVTMGIVGAALTLMASDTAADVSLWPIRLSSSALLIIGLVQAFTWAAPAGLDRAPSELTVMTYNIRGGFGADDRWDLERIAHAIELENPDVVVLEEVTRGWVIASGTDEALWLTRRLGMQMVFGAAAGDLHGNVLLSRYRVDGESLRYSAHVAAALPRGAVSGIVQTERGPLLFIGTHLEHTLGAEDVRRSEASELLELAAKLRPAVIFGDFNAEAVAPELQPLREAGFADGAGSLGVAGLTWPTQGPVRSIDHIFVSQGLRALTARIPISLGSDHLPVVLRLERL